MSKKKYDKIFTNEQIEEMRKEYLEGLSIRDIMKKYNINSNQWVHHKLLNGISRNFSEASKISHQKYPNSFKHSEESKEKMRQKRLQYMREHPESTAWRKRNEPSYPEKCFIKFLQEKGYDKKYLIEREKCVFPFFIDFAFMPVKVAVEIDGSQHIKEKDRVERDKKKDKTLLDNGWRVLRVSENLVKTDWNLLKEKLDLALTGDGFLIEKVGIFVSQKKVREKVKRGNDGFSDKMRATFYEKRKVKNRPTLKEIEKLLETMPMTKVGEMYGVSDNAIRKWIKQYKKNIAGE